MMMKPDYEGDADTRNSSGANKKLPTSKALVVVAGSCDEASIEVVRRPRGRPPGSKNKPKPPIIITREAESAMRPYILEISAGQDVVAAVTQYARRKALGLCILAGSGAVANVTLRQPGSSPPAGPTVTFHGHFDILSISATFLPPSPAAGAPPAPPNGFSISLAGAQGQIVGGSVVGALMAVGTVVVVAAVFGSPTYLRLPVDEETSSSGGPPPASAAEAEAAAAAAARQHHAAAEGCAMSLYSGHMPADVIWAPPTRSSHPRY